MLKKIDQFYNKHILPLEEKREFSFQVHYFIVFIKLIDKFIAWLLQFLKKKIALLFKKKEK